jgi:hypothetical protein
MVRMNPRIACRASLPILLAFAAPSMLLGAENTIVFDVADGWTIRSDLNRGYRCFAEADYDNGSAVRAGFNSEDGSFYLSVADYGWNWIETGTAYTIALAFDDDPSVPLSATGIMLQTDYVQPGLRLDIPADTQEQLYAHFMNRAEMHVAHEDHVSLTLGLVGTRRAMLLLEECQAAMERAIGTNTSSSSL